MQNVDNGIVWGGYWSLKRAPFDRVHMRS